MAEQGSVSCLVIVAANVIVCVTLMRAPWKTEARHLPTKPGHQRRAPTRRRLLHPGVHEDSLRRTSICRLWYGPTWLPPRLDSCLHPGTLRIILHRLLRLSSTRRQPPSPLHIPVRQSRRPPSDWTALLPHCLVGRAVSGIPPEGQGLPISAAGRGPRGHERTRIATAQTATPLDAKRDSLSGRDKPCGLGCPWTQASPLDSTHTTPTSPTLGHHDVPSCCVSQCVPTTAPPCLREEGIATQAGQAASNDPCAVLALGAGYDPRWKSGSHKRTSAAHARLARFPAAAFCVANRLVSSTTAAGQSPYKEVDRSLLSCSVFSAVLARVPSTALMRSREFDPHTPRRQHTSQQ